MLKRIGAVVFTALLVTSTAPAKPDRTVLGTDLKPTSDLRRASELATEFLKRQHYRKTKLDNALSERILDGYIEALDPNRSFFVASDIKAFQAYRHSLDEALAGRDLRPAFAIFNIYRQRVDQRVAFALDQLKQPFRFDVDEQLELDRSELPWAKGDKDLDELWRKRVKNDYLRLKLTDKEPEKIVETLTDRFEGLQRRVDELDAQDVFQYYMNAFATAIEPHTGYMAPRSSENFQIQMRLSLEGIGAVLQRENEYTTVRRVVPGGPASRDGQLKVGDRIVGVAQGGEETSKDVIGWRLDDVVEMIRGEKGSIVHLDVIPADSKLDSQPVTISIERDQVKLEEQAAQKSIYELKDERGQTHRIGVIDLPAFYLDFAGRAQNKPDYRSSTRDVRKLLRELRQAKVDGVIVDLRNNGGGSLLEATTLTGLFIDEGPVVQVKDSRRVEAESDEEPGVEWDGPLAVLVNRHSASASEIFAAAIQDYERGLIIGEQTFGKGTVQNLVNLDNFGGRGDKPRFGQLKLTVAQFFRVSGGSTQNRGVIPDISFPTLDDSDEHGESSLDNALPWSSIEATEYKLADELSPVVPVLARRSSDRISKDTEFQYLLEDIKQYREARDQTMVSLLESARRSQQAEEEKQREARKAAREAWTGEDDNVALIQDDRERFADADTTAASDDSEDEASTDGEDSDERDDVLLEETIRILGDLVALADPSRRTAMLEADRNQGR